MIERVAVIGAGTMGHALALVHALGGCAVKLQDVSAVALERAPPLIGAALQTLIEAGEVATEEAANAMDRIVVEPDLAAAIEDAHLVVEAVAEHAEVKRTLFAAIDAAAPDRAIIASNTSYLDVFPLLAARRQARSLIAHWYTPPYVVDLVDLVPGPKTRPEVIQEMRRLYQDLGKEPIVFKEMIPGYIANRIQAAIGLEVYRMLDEGWVSAEDIDRSIHHGLSLRFALLGVLKKADYTGLALVQQSLANRAYTPPEPTGRSATLDRLIAQGRTGVMAGAGFFDYGDKPAPTLFRERDLKLLELKRALRTIAGDGPVE
jgi:3-hydroxybutyryl-CoA dehydrogenase